MKRAAIAVPVWLGLAASPALAVDWSLLTSQSQTVELNSNLFLNTPPAGVVGSYSLLSAKAEARTPITKFNLDVDGSYRKNWGPAANLQASEFINYGVNARYEFKEKTAFDREYVETSWRQQSTALALLRDLGVATNVNGFLDRLTLGGGIDRTLTALDSISLRAFSTRTSYEPATGGTPFTDTLATGFWRHNLSPIAAMTTSSEAEFLNFDNAFNTRIQIYRNQIGTDLALSPQLSFRGSVGPAVTSIQGGVPATGPIVPFGSTSTDWIGNAVLTYKMFRDTTLIVAADQSISPSIVGSLFKRDSLTTTLNYTINSHSSLSLSASGNRQVSTTTTDFASASAGYTHEFTREWNAQLSYRYLHRFSSSGTTIFDPITGLPTVTGLGAADSHSILMVVTHSYMVLPP